MAGLCSGARYLPSPNCDARPEQETITLLVIHNISLPPGEFGGAGVIALFTNQLDTEAHPYYQTLQGLRVSAHFYVRRDGEVIQFVPCELRAWHAGVSSWRGRPKCNDYAIGIELEGTDHIAYTEAQYDALIALTQALFNHYGPLEIAGHADIAPERKTDPGPAFDWARFRLAVDRENTDERR
ncbi:MAG: 1,6-anhydro-N-acetylmuramyl-L-alanine amidase AmpD [Betaproteobacteria bacterium]|nr:1,6-anhydro-N-acetylmuramyl-L-alanine amidase AmpD [Betaproteobacteria bacterium]